MTIDHEAPTTDLFGLAGTFPRPGWVVLDAAREHQFTGELVLDTVPEVRVYLDRGDIYLAERVTDPSIGSRLVDAGALNAAQLERGRLRIGEQEHLGRLFERVPSVDRHAVLVTAELMTDECVGWVATQLVRDIALTPYRHHPSGVHGWDRPARWVDLVPGEPLPAPAPGEAPVEIVAPEPLFGLDTSFDEMISWDQPSWLDERPPEPPSASAAETPPVPPPPPVATTLPASAPVSEPSRPSASPGIEPQAEPSASAPTTEPVGVEPPVTPPPTEPPERSGADLPATGDWIDRLETEGLPEPGSDPLASVQPLPTIPIEPIDRFEVIWPSGEVDEQFGATDVAEIDRHPDLDRAGPTARIARNVEPSTQEGPGAPTTDEPGGPDDQVSGRGELGASSVTDDVVLAVRRAVASIETGSLPDRRTEPAADPTADVPGRLAVRSDPAMRTATPESSAGMMAAPTRSVFDDVPVASPLEQATPAEAPSQVESPTPDAAPSAQRTSALRRLISSLRGR